jgi:hypothetical protein
MPAPVSLFKQLVSHIGRSSHSAAIQARERRYTDQDSQEMDCSVSAADAASPAERRLSKGPDFNDRSENTFPTVHNMG